MDEREAVLRAVRSALRGEPRLDLHRHPIALDFSDGTLILEGEVADVAAKKLALERAAALPAVASIVDRLRVEPAQAMADGEIRDLVCHALLQDSAFQACAIRAHAKGALESLREPPVEVEGWIEVRVEEGVVTLDGEAPSLAHKRLAGVLAWWVPGSRDVVNGLGVEPPEEDNDDEITEAVRQALEKDGFVDASQIRVATRDRVVYLSGLVPTESEKEMAEFDAWYVFGVDRVVNGIKVGS